MQMFNTHQAKTQLSRLMALTLAGEEVVIAHAGKPTIKLSPYKTTKKKPRIPGFLKGKIWVSPDFDDEMPEFNKLYYGK